MNTDLTWIGERARKEPELVSTSLYHHITDVDNLRVCYEDLCGSKAVGVDGRDHMSTKTWTHIVVYGLTERLTEELDVWENRLFGSVRGLAATGEPEAALSTRPKLFFWLLRSRTVIHQEGFIIPVCICVATVIYGTEDHGQIGILKDRFSQSVWFWMEI